MSIPSSDSLPMRAFGGRKLVVMVSVSLVLVLMAVLMQRLNVEMDRAEKAQFMLRLEEIRSAVLLLNASLVAKSEQHKAIDYEGYNPFKWMEAFLEKDQGIPNYVGEAKLSSLGDQAGIWTFDPEESVIAYRPRSWDWLRLPDEVKTRKKDQDWLKFKVLGLRSREAPGKVNRLELTALQSVSWE